MIFCFDMDGTIADLYHVDNWLDKLRSEDASPYMEAKPMWDMRELNAVLMLLLKEGHEVRVISWLAKDSTPAYKEAVRQAKREWLKKWDFPAERIHLIAYGATKADSVRKAAHKTPAILIDDNASVRKGWHLGETIDPTAVDLVETLLKYVERA